VTQHYKNSSLSKNPDIYPKLLESDVTQQTNGSETTSTDENHNTNLVQTIPNIL